MSLCGTSFNHLLSNHYSPKPVEGGDKSDDISWHDDTSTVALTDESTFRSTLKKKRHAIVMFYAPCMFS